MLVNNVATNVSESERHSWDDARQTCRDNGGLFASTTIEYTWKIVNIDNTLNGTNCDGPGNMCLGQGFNLTRFRVSEKVHSTMSNKC